MSALSRVERHFQSLHLNASREWIGACVEWCLEEVEGVRGDHDRLCKACVEQWRDTDIREDGVQEESRVRGQFDLDKIRGDARTTIPAGAYTMQVCSSVNKTNRTL